MNTDIAKTKIESDEKLFGEYLTNISHMSTIEDLFNYVNNLFYNERPKLITEYINTDNEYRKREIGKKIHLLTNFYSCINNEEGFMDWYCYYRFNESPPHIDIMELVTALVNPDLLEKQRQREHYKQERRNKWRKNI